MDKEDKVSLMFTGITMEQHLFLNKMRAKQLDKMDKDDLIKQYDRCKKIIKEIESKYTYYEINKIRLNEYNRRYYLLNKEKIKFNRKLNHQENKERDAKTNRAYYLKNKEKNG